MVEPSSGGSRSGARRRKRRRARNPWPRRVKRILAWGVPALVVLVLLFHIGGGFYFASVLNERALSGEARRAALAPEYTIEVLARDDGTITLKGAGEDRLTREGTYGLAWEGGEGTLGRVLSHNLDGRVVREFQEMAGARVPLQVGMRAQLDTRVYPADPAVGLGVQFESVTFRGQLGSYPAWFIPGVGTTWYIFVHGNGMTRRDGLRFIPAVGRAGLPMLFPTYRNDPDAPANADDRLTYGKEEWRDLEAAVDYAVARGAQSVILHGVSMGGGVVASFLLESDRAKRVLGVILDSPMLDFERCVEFQAGEESLPLVRLPLPGTLVASAEWIAARRYGIDWESTDYLARAKDLAAPMLLIHGIADKDVPIALTDELAKKRPELVRSIYRVPGAGHVESWNVNPAEYERRMQSFFVRIGAVK